MLVWHINTRCGANIAFSGQAKTKRVFSVQFSGPVTALTTRRVRHGVGPDLICQPSPSPGIKTHSSPAAFPATLSLPFLPSLFTLLHSPTRSCLRPRRAPLTPCDPPPHTTDTTRPVGKMPQRDRLALIRSTPRQHCLLDHLTRASTLG
jgi:hypothetical protein